MAKRANSRPTDAELAILGVLWQQGASTVRSVHEQITTKSEPVGYTTVLKTMQIMAEKDLVTRDESNRAHVYRARRSEEQTQRHLLRDLTKRAFRGSASNLVMQALSGKKASPEEIESIRRILDKMSGDKQ